jgi:hypothetical protein
MKVRIQVSLRFSRGPERCSVPIIIIITYPRVLCQGFTWQWNEGQDTGESQVSGALNVVAYLLSLSLLILESCAKDLPGNGMKVRIQVSLRFSRGRGLGCFSQALC